MTDHYPCGAALTPEVTGSRIDDEDEDDDENDEEGLPLSGVMLGLGGAPAPPVVQRDSHRSHEPWCQLVAGRSCTRTGRPLCSSPQCGSRSSPLCPPMASTPSCLRRRRLRPHKPKWLAGTPLAAPMEPRKSNVCPPCPRRGDAGGPAPPRALPARASCGQRPMRRPERPGTGRSPAMTKGEQAVPEPAQRRSGRRRVPPSRPSAKAVEAGPGLAQAEEPAARTPPSPSVSMGSDLD